MYKRFVILCFVLVAQPSACATRPVHEAAGTVTAFTHVNVAPMDREQVLVDQTVIVRGDTITEIGAAATISVPVNALRIDARGQYLMPGLADMHVHVQSESELLLAVANGVTTLRDMFGSPYKVAWRERIERGELLGPTLYTSGPIVDGARPDMSEMTRVVSDEDAERVVAGQKRRGYDFIKVYDSLSASAYRALLESAHRHAIPVAGHVTPAVGLYGALRAGQRAIEHLDGYVDAMQAGNSPYASPPRDGRSSMERFLRSIRHVDESRIPALAAATRDAGVWNCPTLVAYRDWGFTRAESAARFARADVRLVHPILRAQWAPTNQADIPYANADLLRSEEAAMLMKRRVRVHQKLTKALIGAGAGVLLGTDAGVPFVVPGPGALDELLLMVEAGLSPYEALRTGTAAPAEFLGATARFGTVRVGARADLILLRDNPLRDVAAVRQRVGVMLRGRWMPAGELRQRVDALVASYDAPRDWFAGMPDLTGTARWDTSLRFAISTLGVPKGEERVFILTRPHDSVITAAQLGSSEPDERYTVRFEGDGGHERLRIDSVGREGAGHLAFEQHAAQLRVHGRLPVVGDIAQTASSRGAEFLASPGIAWSLWLFPRLTRLAVNAKIEIPVRQWDFGAAYELSARTWKITRRPDENTQDRALRVFEIEVLGDAPLYTSRLSVDKDGLPVELDIRQGDGTVRFTRIEP